MSVCPMCDAAVTLMSLHAFDDGLRTVNGCRSIVRGRIIRNTKHVHLSVNLLIMLSSGSVRHRARRLIIADLYVGNMSRGAALYDADRFSRTIIANVNWCQDGVHDDRSEDDGRNWIRKNGDLYTRSGLMMRSFWFCSSFVNN